MCVAWIVAGAEFDSIDVEGFELFQNLTQRKLGEQRGKNANLHANSITAYEPLRYTPASYAHEPTEHSAETAFSGSSRQSKCYFGRRAGDSPGAGTAKRAARASLRCSGLHRIRNCR